MQKLRIWENFSNQKHLNITVLIHPYINKGHKCINFHWNHFKFRKKHKNALKIIKFLMKIAKKNQFFFFRLDSPELNFKFLCHTYVVKKSTKSW